MGRTVSKLIDLDIDEVSLVDRAANQHSLVAFSKSLHEGASNHLEDSVSADISVFNDTGEEVDANELEHGDTVFDADGNEYVFVEDGEEDEVGKADLMRTARVMGRRKGRQAKDMFNRIPTGAKYGAAAGAGVGAGMAAGSYSKSLSEEILEDFSKAVTDRDRDYVIAKAMDEVSKAQEIAKEAMQWAEYEHDARMTEAFISKAAEYNLPVAPDVLGPILKSLAEALTDEQLDVLDEIFNAVGDTLYDEIGYVGGGSNSSVFDQVDAFASEFVGKSDLSREQATTLMFEANPAAYDAYISEMGR
jgi:hypothetical protein